MVTTSIETWKVLFGHALSLIDDILRHGTKDLYWTFGGGTVLMLRHNHRFSKDIDIFVPDPQALGFVTPRLSSHAESLTTDYTEAANFVKLFLPEGEIDFVASRISPTIRPSKRNCWAGQSKSRPRPR